MTGPGILCSFFLLILTKRLTTGTSSLSFWSSLTQECDTPPLVHCLSFSVFAYPWPCPSLCTVPSGLPDSARVVAPQLAWTCSSSLLPRLCALVYKHLWKASFLKHSNVIKEDVFAGDVSCVAVHSLAAECVCSFLGSYPWPERLKITSCEPLSPSALSPKPVIFNLLRDVIGA